MTSFNTFDYVLFCVSIKMKGSTLTIIIFNLITYQQWFICLGAIQRSVFSYFKLVVPNPIAKHIYKIQDFTKH